MLPMTVFDLIWFYNSYELSNTSYQWVTVQCVNLPVVRAVYFLSASLYVSKRGAYWDRLCRDVVGRWLVVGCHARALWPNGASYAYSYYGTLIGNSTPGIQWYNFRPPGVTPNRGMGPREALFVKLLWPLVHFYRAMLAFIRIRLTVGSEKCR